MTSSGDKSIRVREKFHIFHRDNDICRYGIYGLSRHYSTRNATIPESEEGETITLEIPSPKLRVLQAVITADCNLSCTYCSFRANAPSVIDGKMSLAELMALSRLFNESIGTEGLLLITGGEPELYPEAIDYLIENVQGKIIMFTNGTFARRDRLSYYRDRKVGVLFSLDGDLFAQDSVRRGRNGSYTKVAQALNEAAEVGLDFGISAVVGDHNIERLPELVENIYDKFQPASLGLNLPHRYGEIVWNGIEAYTKALIDIFQFAKENVLFVDQINRRLAPLVERKFRYRDCSAQGEKLVVFPGGTTTSCVNQAGLKNGEIDWVNRIPILSDDCGDCHAIGICGGGCVFDGEAIYGPGRFDERNCYFTKKMLEHFIWDFHNELGDDATNSTALQKRYGSMLKRTKGTHFSVGHETV